MESAGPGPFTVFVDLGDGNPLEIPASPGQHSIPGTTRLRLNSQPEPTYQADVLAQLVGPFGVVDQASETDQAQTVGIRGSDVELPFSLTDAFGPESLQSLTPQIDGTLHVIILDNAENDDYLQLGFSSREAYETYMAGRIPLIRDSLYGGVVNVFELALSHLESHRRGDWIFHGGSRNRGMPGLTDFKNELSVFALQGITSVLVEQGLVDPASAQSGNFNSNVFPQNSNRFVTIDYVLGDIPGFLLGPARSTVADIFRGGQIPAGWDQPLKDQILIRDLSVNVPFQVEPPDYFSITPGSSPEFEGSATFGAKNVTLSNLGGLQAEGRIDLTVPIEKRVFTIQALHLEAKYTLITDPELAPNGPFRQWEVQGGVYITVGPYQSPHWRRKRFW